MLYYGCANVSIAGDVYKICATSVDEDYNALGLAWCNDFCHVQCELPVLHYMHS